MKRAKKVVDAKRSLSLVVRVSPKLRYLAEIAARAQRRTVSSFAEWAIEEVIRTIELPGGDLLSVHSLELWDVDEPDRFAKLALLYPSLLTHDEQVLWKRITIDPKFWKGNQIRNETTLNWEALRADWDTLKKVARGELPENDTSGGNDE